MSRPLQLVAVGLVYLLGALIAEQHGATWDTQRLLWGALLLMPVAVSIHYANEYADYATDALTQRTPFSGGSGALPKGFIPRRWALYGARGALGFGLALGLIAHIHAIIPLPAYLILCLGAIGGWMYSLPPLLLAWRGWGELDNALLGGLALPCYGYAVLAGHINTHIIILMLPFTALVFINLLATTWPDRIADAQVGKYTLATRLQPSLLRFIYAGGVTFFVLTALCVACFWTQKTYLFCVLCALPFVAWGLLRYTRQNSPHHSVLAMVAMLLSQLVWAFF